MTNDLEKQFFDTFGIEPHYYCADEYVFEAMLEYECTEGNREKCKACKKVGKAYPQISDRILLELIRIIGLITIKYTNKQCEICYGDGAISYLGKNLKEAILNFFISKVLIFKHQVRTLFEEG